MEEKQLTRKGKFFDYSLLIIVLFLVAFGLVMVYSTSSYTAAIKFNDAAYYLKKQLVATVIGLVCMLVAALVDYHVWYKIAVPIFILSLLSILAVMTPLGMNINGAKRWINVGFTSIQPAEIVKLGLIITLASFATWSGKNMQMWRYRGIYMLFALAAAGMIFVITRNLSTAVILVGIAFVMLLISDPKPWWLFALAAVAVVGIAIYLIYCFNTPMEGATSFRSKRVLAWINPELYADDESYQTLQALYAIGSGGFWGKGLGASIQKLGFIPEAQNDMIFSVVCEELGLFGGICLIVLFLLMMYRFMTIAHNAPDRFGGLLATGVMAHIAFQVVFNIAVVTNTVPNTGITLPFISYGGTSVMFLLIEMGIVLNVSRQIQVPDRMRGHHMEKVNAHNLREAHE